MYATSALEIYLDLSGESEPRIKYATVHIAPRVPLVQNIAGQPHADAINPDDISCRAIPNWPPKRTMYNQDS